MDYSALALGSGSRVFINDASFLLSFVLTEDPIIFHAFKNRLPGDGVKPGDWRESGEIDAQSIFNSLVVSWLLE